MAVLFAKEACEHEMVIDLHGGLINLAKVLQHEPAAVELYNRLQRVLYCDDVFDRSKEYLEQHGEGLDVDEIMYGGAQSITWAYHYFIASWMGRNGVSGTQRYNYQMATRWTAGGGSGPLRFMNAVDSIPPWHQRLKNVHVMRRNVFDVIDKIDDAHSTVIYCDPPYLWDTMSGSSRYLHDFEKGDHERLAKSLRGFRKARVIVSYYDSPLLSELYPGWCKLDCSRQKHLYVQTKRGSGRQTAPEVLLVNGVLMGDGEDRGLFV